MKVFLINANLKVVTEVEIESTREAIQELIGFKTIDADEIDSNFDQLFFERGTMLSPALSVAHRRIAFERSFGPLKQTILNLAGDTSKLKALRSELDEIIAPHFYANQFHQSYLMTRCVVMK